MDLEQYLSDRITIEDGHWLWTGATGTGGYGRAYVKRAHISAHRLSWEVYNGLIPEDKLVLHKNECNTKHCINPEHLYLGTYQDNANDRMALGAYNARRTPAQVHEIRFLYKSGGFLQRALATMYDVSHQAVGRIVRNELYRYIT